MTKHTPGPWELLPNDEGVSYLRIRGTRNVGISTICNVYHGVNQGHPIEESKANARLISVAPEMLGALEACRDRILSLFLKVAVCDADLHDCLAELNQADAVIAKAKGVQHD